MAGDSSAQQQGITNISWRCEDLSNSDIVSALTIHNKTKVLLDPSREGAHTVCEQRGCGLLKEANFNVFKKLWP